MEVLMVDSLLGNDYAICLCNALKDAGANVSLVTIEDRGKSNSYSFVLRPWGPSKNYRLSKLQKTIKYNIYLSRLLLHIMTANGKIVHFQFFRRERLESIYLLLLRLLGVSIVYTAHNILPHEGNGIDSLLRYIVYKSSGAIIVHSESTKKRLMQAFKFCGDKTRVIPHGNFDIYLPDNPISKLDARSRLSLAESDNVILFFGYIREYKGLGLLLDAFEIASMADGHLKLIIAGAARTGELAERYQKRINTMRARDKMVFHCQFIPQEDVPLYFTASDLVVLPYKHIDHSGIVHLAYSFKRPVIATRVGDFEDVIEHEKSGYIAEPNDALQLASTITQAFSNMDKLAEMGKFAGHLSDTKYSWKDVAKKTMEVYEDLSAH